MLITDNKNVTTSERKKKVKYVTIEIDFGDKIFT